MTIQTGELLISDQGYCYRVVEFQDETVSLMRVDGYTLVSFSLFALEKKFRPVGALAT